MNTKLIPIEIGKKTKIISAIISIIICIAFIIYAYHDIYNYSNIPKSNGTEISPNVWRFVFNDISKGSEFINHNTITNIGERWHRNIFGFNNVSNLNATKWISSGNATVSASLTKLTTETTTNGFERALATVTEYNYGNDYGYNVTITFTATAQINVNAFGLHWMGVSNSDNNMYACNAITAQTFSTGSKAIIIWLNLMDDN
jgi:hypothetical protein